jgi:hypothetical protein
MVAAPPTGTQLIIVRNVPATQETDYLANDPFPAESHERALDKLTMLVQQVELDADRALKIPLSSLATTSTELPAPSANKLLAWNSNASAVTNFDPASVITIVGQQASFSNVFIGNGVTVNFTLSRTPGNANAVDVSINGVTQVPNVDYILNGNILTFTTAPPRVASQILARYTEVFAEPNGDAANVRYQPAGSGAVATNVQAKLRQIVSVDDFGAVGNGVTNDTAAIQAAVDSLLGVGGEVEVNAGTYKLVGPVVMDYAGRTGDAGTNPTGISFVGQGIQSTLFKPSVNGDAAIEILGDNIAGHLIYGPFGRFTVTPQSGATGTIGAYLYDVAFASFDEMFFQDMPVAIRAESVLSCQFNRLRITGGGNGVVAFKGTGFSDHNANKYFGAEFRLGTGWAYSGGPSSGLWFDNLTVQGFGTQSADAGGMDLSFTGDEGAVGVNVNGGYIEGNGGAADFRLTNSGTNTVTHVFTSVNFNRISSSKYVTHNIHAFGKNKIVLIGCSFRGFGTYTPDAARKYVEFDPTETEVICIGCDFGSAVESSNLTNLRVFSGRVDSAGAAVFLPYGWSCAKNSTGVYTVSHSLGTSLYSVNATSINANPISVQRSVVNDNTFTIALVNTSAALTDSAFSFQLSF